MKVEVLSYERLPDSGYWDANWINARVEIKARSFSGTYLAQLQTLDFSQFKKGVESLYANLEGITQFNSMEDWLKIIIRGDGIGHFDVECEACDIPGTGNRLEFKMEIDQTEIPRLIDQLDDILTKFPVRGQPDSLKK